MDENKVWFTGGYWPEGVPHQIYEIEDIYVSPMFEGFCRQADKFGYWDDVVCVFALGPYMERITFRKLAEYAKRFGTFLHDELGVRKGDTVAIDFPNSINFVVAYMGCQYVGAVVAGVNPQYKPLEIVHCLDITNAKVLVLMDALWKMGFDQFLKRTKVESVVSTNLLDFVTAPPDIFEKIREKVPDFQPDMPDEHEGVKVHKNMKEICERTEPREIEVDIDPWEDPACYLMTGGTTGLPKAAVLTHANLITNLHMLRPWTNLEKGMVTIGSIPFFHSFGMTCVMNAALALGMQMLLFPKPPDDQTLCETINKLEAPQGIMYTGVEMLFKRLTDFVQSMGEEEFKKKYDIWKKLRYTTQGAGPLHDYVREPYERLFGPIRSGYGLTETSPVVSVAPFWGPVKPEKLGLPLPGVDWAIWDPDETKWDEGPICDGTKERGNFGIEHTGEICVAGPMVMKGYLGHQEQNIREWGGKRWLLTGDIGFMDEHGFCEIRDRKKSLIKVSGHSVFPKEVEQLMGAHPMVDEVAVAGIPDEMTGEAVKAWVTLKEGYKAGRDITPEQLKQWCLENFTKWKTPKYVEFVRRLPVSMTGKVQRRVLQEKDIEKLKKGRKIKG
ncbi:MAG: long-chain fatty acid--CoA ligase [Promethearchaeota archaeon]